MSQADRSITSGNHPAQGNAGEIVRLALEYHWAKAMFEPAHADGEINAVGDQVKAICGAIANTRAKSIHDMRAKLAIFRLEEDGELSDHNALALIEGIAKDLDEWPAASVTSGPSLLTLMADRLCAILATELADDDSVTGDEETAIREAAPYLKPQTLSDVAFLLLLANTEIGLLHDLCDTDLTHEQRKAEAAKNFAPVNYILRTAMDALLAHGAQLCSILRQVYMADYLDPRLTEKERDSLRGQEPGTLDRLLIAAGKGARP